MNKDENTISVPVLPLLGQFLEAGPHSQGPSRSALGVGTPKQPLGWGRGQLAHIPIPLQRGDRADGRGPGRGLPICGRILGGRGPQRDPHRLHVLHLSLGQFRVTGAPAFGGRRLGGGRGWKRKRGESGKDTPSKPFTSLASQKIYKNKHDSNLKRES